MAISSLVNAPAPTTDKGPSCGVCRAIEELPESEAAALVALLSNPAWPFKAIAEAVKTDPDLAPEFDWVRKIAGSTYGRHATAGCAAQVRLRQSRR